jgi:hypothetical protein
VHGSALLPLTLALTARALLAAEGVPVTLSVLLEGTRKFQGFGPACVDDITFCNPPLGDLMEAACALAPELNLDVVNGVLRA